MTLLARSGFKSENLFTDLGLGFTTGLDMSLWCFVYASLIYAGGLSAFMPVGVLSLLLGWVLVGTWVALTSNDPLHIADLDDQGMVIFGSIAALMTLEMGDRAASPQGLATLLTVIALTSLAFSVSCYLVGKYRLSRMLELLPYPVICGFMASIGWLLLGAGFEVMAGVDISFRLLAEVEANGRSLQLGLSALLGFILLVLTNRLDRSWTLPAASALLVACYYVVVNLGGMSQEQQQAQGWLFTISEGSASVLPLLADLSARDIDWGFIAGVVPQMLTILLLAMLYASMTLTALKSDSPCDLSISREFKLVGGGNLLAAAVCSPPSYTEVVTTTMFRQFGASSRWMPLSACAVGFVVILFGSSIIGYLPKLLIGATIFLFSFQMLHDWLYGNVKDFSLLDFAIVLTIFGTAIAADFMTAIAVGVLLTVLLFVLRYSMISAIQARHTLSDHRSSVERSVDETALLGERGKRAVIYSLRGFLFFGSANGILETIQTRERFGKKGCKVLLLEMSHVTGVDISAFVIFTRIRKVCAKHGALLAYSNPPEKIEEKLLSMGAVDEVSGRPLLFDNADYAKEFIENLLLGDDAASASDDSIRDYLCEMIEDREQVDRLLEIADTHHCRAGETLFHEGDPDNGLFIVEKGSFSAFIRADDGSTTRVRKFKPGSLIGELSAYMKDKRRTATIVADTASVACRLDLQSLERSDPELAATVHEMIAMTLAERIHFMNLRLSASV